VAFLDSQDDDVPTLHEVSETAEQASSDASLAVRKSEALAARLARAEDRLVELERVIEAMKQRFDRFAEDLETDGPMCVHCHDAPGGCPHCNP